MSFVSGKSAASVVFEVEQTYLDPASGRYLWRGLDRQQAHTGLGAWLHVGNGRTFTRFRVVDLSGGPRVLVVVCRGGSFESLYDFEDYDRFRRPEEVIKE